MKVNFEVEGSFLRSLKLIEKRRQMADELISLKDLNKFEDLEIEKLIKKQKEHGLKLITDGQLRRRFYDLDFFWDFDNIYKVFSDDSRVFYCSEMTGESLEILGKVRSSNHPIIREYEYLKQFEDEIFKVKITIPAPTMLYKYIREDRGEETYKKYYMNDEDLITDITESYINIIDTLYKKGLRYIEFDDECWAEILDDNYIRDYENNGVDLKELKDIYLKLNNEVFEALPTDLYKQLHVFRGNFLSDHFAEGGFEKISKSLFKNDKSDCLYLEFEDDYSGNLDCLADYPKNKDVTIGIVSAKFDYDNYDKLREKIETALKYIDKKHLKLGTTTGFAATEEGNKICSCCQWRKIDLLKKLSESYLDED